MSCPERDLHLMHYQDAVRAYRSAVLGLDPSLSASDFEVTYKRAKEARGMFEHTRQQLKAHLDARRCRPASSSEQF